MAVVLDTDDLLPADRAEAVRAAMRDARVPADLSHDPDVAQVRARIEVWELGGGVSLVHRAGTGVALTRTPRQVRSHAEERASLTLLGPGRWRFAQGTVEQVVDDGRWSACLVDQSAPYGFERVGPSQMYAIGVDPKVLGLPLDVVREAARRVADSPLLDMVVRHVTSTRQPSNCSRRTRASPRLRRSRIADTHHRQRLARGLRHRSVVHPAVCLS